MRNSQPKVLHIIDKMGQGGAQVLVHNIVENDAESMDLFELGPPNNISIDNNFGNKYSIIQLFRYLRSYKVDILHLHLIKSVIVGILLKVFFFRNLKIIVHDHGSFQRYQYKKLSHKIGLEFALILIRLFRNQIELIISISNNLETELQNTTKIDGRKIVILPNFISPKIDKQKIGKNKMINQNFIFGFAGRLEIIKGIDDLLDAFFLLSKEQQDVKLIIAGEGSLKNHLILKVQQMKLNNIVEFDGYIEDMNEFYSKIDCLVMPSRFEGMGLTHLEAQSVGIPIICSNAEGMSETISSSNALIFEKENIQELKLNLIEIKTNSTLRMKLTQSGMENAKHYNFNNYMRRYHKLLSIICVSP